MGFSSRLLPLPDFSQIYVAQVGLGGIAVKGFDSLRTHPSVSVNIRYADPQNPEAATEIFHMDEVEILSLLTGNKGGIAIFHGMNRDEDNAFVFEKGTPEGKQGFVFFVHPTDTPLLGLNSVEGMKGFLKHLNEGFEDPAAGSYPLQIQALAQLVKDVEGGSLHFTSPVRQELFKSIVIANARLATKTNDPVYRISLEAMLPNLRSSLLVKIFGFSTDERAKIIEREIDRIVGRINSATKPLPVSEHKSPKEPPEIAIQILDDLRTPKAKKLREAVVGYFGSNSTQMYDYLNRLAFLCEKATTTDEFDDAIRLLQEVRMLPQNWGVFAQETGGYALIAYEGWANGSDYKRFKAMDFSYYVTEIDRGMYGRGSIKTLIARTEAHRKTLLIGG